MKVLQTGGPSLEERVKRNMPLLGGTLQPEELFNDMSPVFHEFDRTKIRLVIERRETIPEIMFYMIWDAAKRRPDWEEHFVRAVRKQGDHRVLKALGIPEESAQDTEKLEQKQVPRGASGGHDESWHSKKNLPLQIYQNSESVQRPHSAQWDKTHPFSASVPAPLYGQYFGQNMGYGHVQPSAGHERIPSFGHLAGYPPHPGPYAPDMTTGHSSDTPSQMIKDQISKMQYVQTSAEGQRTANREVVKNMTDYLEADNADALTEDRPEQIQPSSSRLQSMGYNQNSPSLRHYENSQQPGLLTNGSQAMQSSAMQYIPRAPMAKLTPRPPPERPSHVPGLSDSESSYNIPISIVDNTAYPGTTEKPSSVLAAPENSDGSNHDDMGHTGTLHQPLNPMSTGFLADGGELALADLSADSGELQPDAESAVLSTHPSEQSGADAARPAAQTGSMVSTNPRADRSMSIEAPQSPQIVLHIGVLHCRGPAVFGTNNSINSQMVRKSAKLRTARGEEGSTQSLDEPEESESAPEEERTELFAGQPGENVNGTQRSPPTGSVADETQNDEPVSSESGSVCLPSNPFSTSEYPRLTNLKAVDAGILHIDDTELKHSPASYYNETAQSKPAVPEMSSGVPDDASDLQAAESLLLARKDPRHETFVKEFVETETSEQTDIHPAEFQSPTKVLTPADTDRASTLSENKVTGQISNRAGRDTGQLCPAIGRGQFAACAPSVVLPANRHTEQAHSLLYSQKNETGVSREETANTPEFLEKEGAAVVIDTTKPCPAQSVLTGGDLAHQKGKPDHCSEKLKTEQYCSLASSDLAEDRAVSVAIPPHSFAEQNPLEAGVQQICFGETVTVSTDNFLESGLSDHVTGRATGTGPVFNPSSAGWSCGPRLSVRPKETSGTQRVKALGSVCPETDTGIQVSCEEDEAQKCHSGCTGSIKSSDSGKARVKRKNKKHRKGRGRKKREF